MKKHFILWLKTLLATALTVVLSVTFGRMFSFTTFAFAWGLNFMLMGWYTYLISLFAPGLNTSYFKPQPFEQGGKIYRYLGVHLYRRLLVLVGWEKISRQANPIRNNLSDLRTCEYNTRVAELGHTLIALLVLALTPVVCRSWDEAKWLLITNLLLNVYPIVVQRYNRPRYHRLLLVMGNKRLATEKV